MPLYKIQIFKNFGGESKEWSNVYHANAANVTDAVILGAGIANIERQVHQDYVRFLRVRASNVALPGIDFSVQPIGTTGVLTGFGHSLPNWNVFRIDFTAESGRPSRKYLRCPVTETDQNGGVVESGTLTRLADDYADPLTALFAPAVGDPGLVDVDGQVLVSAQPFTEVRERKTYRRKRKKGTSGPPITS